MSYNDFMLSISFKTAQEIGLEESVLLTFLEQHAFHISSQDIYFEVEALAAHLSFWTTPVILRLLSNLQLCQRIDFKRVENGLLITLSPQSEGELAPVSKASSQGISPANDTALLNKVSQLKRKAQKLPPTSTVITTNANSTPNKVSQDVGEKVIRTTLAWSETPEKNEKRRGISDFDLYLEEKERARQPDKWQPEEATLEQIIQSGIPRQFALQLQTEFLLRIKEQRKNVRTWNSEFFKYVKRQWQYQQSDRSSHEGTQSSSYNPRTSKEQVSDALSNIHDTDW